METPKINAERIKEYLKKGKRFDGRKPKEFRDIVIEKEVSKKAEGSARVKLGKTDVIVGIKMDVTEPYPDSPDKGNLIVSAELLPLSSPRHSLGRPGIDSVEIARVMDRAIRESNFIESEKLCIKSGEKVWRVFIDIYSLNDDGNILDAAAIGTLVALKDAEMPKYDEEKGKVIHGESSGKKIPLSKDIPLSLTLYKVGDKFIADPTREEEDISESRVTIGRTKKHISSMQKGQVKGFDTKEFGDVLDAHKEAWEDVYKKIEKHLK